MPLDTTGVDPIASSRKSKPDALLSLTRSDNEAVGPRLWPGRDGAGWYWSGSYTVDDGNWALSSKGAVEFAVSISSSSFQFWKSPSWAVSSVEKVKEDQSMSEYSKCSSMAFRNERWSLQLALQIKAPEKVSHSVVADMEGATMCCGWWAIVVGDCIDISIEKSLRLRSMNIFRVPFVSLRCRRIRARWMSALKQALIAQACHGCWNAFDPKTDGIEVRHSPYGRGR